MNISFRAAQMQSWRRTEHVRLNLYLLTMLIDVFSHTKRVCFFFVLIAFFWIDFKSTHTYKKKSVKSIDVAPFWGFQITVNNGLGSLKLNEPSLRSPVPFKGPDPTVDSRVWKIFRSPLSTDQSLSIRWSIPNRALWATTRRLSYNAIRFYRLRTQVPWNKGFQCPSS